MALLKRYTIFHFHLITSSCLAPTRVYKLSDYEWPSMLLQVNSIDSWGRVRLEGYGFHTFSPVSGYYIHDINTWKPSGSLYSKVHSFFLGGSYKIPRLEELVKSSTLDEFGKQDIINRFGLDTETGGIVQIAYSEAIQTKYDVT